jgi:hypothetical protein
VKQYVFYVFIKNHIVSFYHFTTKIDEFFKDFIFCFLCILSTDVVNNCNIYDNETGLNVIAEEHWM